MQTSHVTGLPVVDSVVVNGRAIPVSCRGNYHDAQRDCLRSVARRTTVVHSPLRTNSAPHPTVALQNGTSA